MRTDSLQRGRGRFVAPIVVAMLALAGAGLGQAVAQSTPEAAGTQPTAPIRIVWPIPGAEISGRDVSVSWQAPGLRIVPAAAAVNPTDYHVHFIVDDAIAVTEGSPLAMQCGVLHTAANPAVLSNLPPGEHTIAMVVADPGHVPVAGLDRPSVTFTVVENPDAIRITAPEQCETVAGPDVAIAWEAPGLTIVPAAEAQNPTDYHVHFIVDGAYEVVAGQPIPEQEGVVHTADNPATVAGLVPGEHTIQLVIADAGHVPVAGLARPTVTILVTEGGATPAAGATPAMS